jgi:mRNA-degrading endonuclease RelE of RelBE toxin-antitoxin system
MTSEYTLVRKPSLKKDLKLLTRQHVDTSEIEAAIESLRFNRYPDGWGKITNLPKGVERLRLPVGDHRIVYEVRDKEEVVIVYGVPRRNEITYKPKSLGL